MPLKPIKKFKSDGKTVKVYNNNPIPKRSVINSALKKLPDDKRVPLAFMTREQYLKKYIHNQEKKNKIDFSPKQERQYINSEMKEYKNIAARYTTKDNPYMPKKIVVFNDKPMNDKEFKFTLAHEVGHEILERKGKKMPLHKEEAKCDEYAKNFLQNDYKSKNMQSGGISE